MENLNFFQINVINFITASMEISDEELFSVILAIQNVDFSTLAPLEFENIFREISFSSDIVLKNKVMRLADRAEFASISTFMTVFLTLQETGVDVENFNTSDTSSVITADFWSLEGADIDLNIISNITASIDNLDISIAQKVASSVAAKSQFIDTFAVLETTRQELNVFQTVTLDFFLANLELSIEEEFLLTSALMSVDFESEFSSLSELLLTVDFDISLMEKITTVVESDVFTSIDVAVNVISAIAVNDVDFDISTFDISVFDDVINKDFFTKTDVSVDVVTELVKAAEISDMTILQAVTETVTKESVAFDVEVTKMDLVAEFNVYQTLILDFIKSFSVFSEDDHFVVISALSTLDISSDVFSAGFSDFFGSINFSNDEKIQARFASLSSSAQFDTLDVAINLVSEIEANDESFNLASFDVTSFKLE